jgi:nucleotide-binding universal stress UspA family protein
MKMLFATDGSEHSERAAKFLTLLNWSPDDNITVFHAAYWIPFRYDEEFYLGTLKEIKKEIATRILDSALDILKPVKAKISVSIVEGSPELCIVDSAADADMDMIVMGSRGIKGIESVFIGSVTRSVVINAAKPVLVVKTPIFSKSGKIKILLATDGSDYAQTTAEFLCSFPFPDNTEVTILNVIWSNIFDIPARFVMDTDELIKNLEAGTKTMEFTSSEKIIAPVREHLNKRFENIHVLSKVGDPSTEILKTAETIGADMIAVGCRGLRGIKGMMGSVSRNILTHAKSSVLIGKTER